MIIRYSYADVAGFEIAPSFHAQSLSSSVSINAEIQAVSGAANTLLRFTLVTPGLFAPTGVTPFGSVSDAADLVFTNSSTGSQAHLLIPAPMAAIFLGDLETINPGALAALSAVVMAGGLTPSGDTIDTFLGGFRRKFTRRGYNG